MTVTSERSIIIVGDFIHHTPIHNLVYDSYKASRRTINVSNALAETRQNNRQRQWNYILLAVSKIETPLNNFQNPLNDLLVSDKFFKTKNY